MARIFLNYVREDEEKVEHLYQRLSDAGFKPWMFKRDFLRGERREPSTQEPIRRSDFFLACLSTNSVNKRGWIQKEITQALHIWQEMSYSDIYLIPVRLEDCRVPESLRDVQWVNLFEEDGWTRLVKAIQVGMQRRAALLPDEEPSSGPEMATPGAASQVFLSYVGEDEEKVEKLYQRLSDTGFKPWMSKKDILPGEIWKLSTHEAIRRSDFFLACLSTNWVMKRGFIQKEIQSALDVLHKKLDSEIYLIPVRLENCEIPDNLRRFQWVDLFEEDGWTRLVKAIQAGMERRAVLLLDEEPSPSMEKATPRATSQVFLSYVGEDEEKVEKLYQRLSDAGFKPWMSKKDILPGEGWELSIQEAIRRSDFFLVCLSASTVKGGRIHKEIKDALDIWQEMLYSDIYLIPVRLEDCEVPEGLRAFQWVDLFEEDGWTQLVKAVQVGMKRRVEVAKPPPKESPERIRQKESQETAQCKKILVDGERCSNRAVPGTDYCEQHRRIQFRRVPKPSLIDDPRYGDIAKEISVEMAKAKRTAGIKENLAIDEESTEAYAVARLREHTEGQPLHIGLTYVLEAGIFRRLAEGFEAAPLILPTATKGTRFEIVVYGEDMYVFPSWFQPYIFDPGKDNLIEFTLVPRATGHKMIRVEFYHQYHWLQQISFVVEVLKTEERVLV